MFHALVGIFWFGARAPHHIHQVEAVLHPLDLLAQQMLQHGNAGVCGPEILKRMTAIGR